MQWIPIAQKLPPDLTAVWVSDGKTVAISQYMFGHQCWAYSDMLTSTITHWQPIVYPEAP